MRGEIGFILWTHAVTDCPQLALLHFLIKYCTMPPTTEEETTLIQRGGGIGPLKPQQPPGITAGKVLSPTVRELEDEGR